MHRESTTTIEALDSLDVTFDLEPERAPELTPIGRLGRYELLGRMAIGGMAEIFLARERAEAVDGSRQLVVKVMRPELERDATYRSMFLNEGHVALRLSHPNLVHVYECGVEAGRSFIAMERVGGVTLRALMKQSELLDHPIPAAVVAKIGAHVADALHSAHRAKDANGRPLGLVHLDVTPQNVMVDLDGSVKLLDFGAAQARTEFNFEQTGTVKGKLGYLAPEQCLGKTLDARVDVFALGVCLWEMLTGQALYPRSADLDALSTVVHDDAPPARAKCHTVPMQLSAIISRALARNPDDRYSSAAEMSQALEQFLADRREIVNGARIGSLVSYLFGGEPPLDLDRRPEVVACLRTIPPARRRSWWLAAPITAALLVAIASIAWAIDDSHTVPITVSPSLSPTVDQPAQSPIEHVSIAAPPTYVIVEVPQPAPVEIQRDVRRPRPGGFVADPGF